MKTLILTPEQADSISQPPVIYSGKPSRYRKIWGTKLLVRLPHYTVVSQYSNMLTDDEYIAVMSLVECPGSDKGTNDGQRDRLWAKKALQEELAALGRMFGDNPHIPGSPIFASFLRIASILKGSGKGHYSTDDILPAILNSLPLKIKTKGNRENDIKYLYFRALRHAKPRYRSVNK